mmetsp:Transcript_2763/g.4009  ORF Transcript_2763/g.4009 Transcript_2763/m.4009 type:complete len:226 (-) Transcript_2763:129-806(-)|eukprot:CAMPEP_0167753028 /NCGR_PEP_ID=MMETSP0110_2-20121227/7479_1 /TAXON_ID=629695 /ORGANISM="Gymnochlora sp., Strain CCMP2014" /LENGTH=225 /DNA_ID=CAMNT_0007638735 /DNA_START=75 /DNA_END=752 /DNA_ORIENTATION=+
MPASSVAAYTALCAASFYLTARLGLGIYAWQSANNLEKPRYNVLKTFNGIELRKYEPYIVAEAKSKDLSFKKATSAGFLQVAGYIFGKNRQRRTKDATKMKMTAPVRTEKKDRRGETSVSFVMSSNYTLSSLPLPLNKNVTLRKIAPHFLAMKKFRGPPPTDDKIKAIKAEILNVLKEKGVGTDSPDDTYVYQYHDPFITPNFLRKNEIGLSLSSASASKLTAEK